MLLAKKTIENIQKAITSSKFSVKDIKVKAVYSTPKITLAEYLLDGELVVSQLYPVAGSKISDLILDAAAFSDYYLLSEVYGGLEKDDTAELILEIWPCTGKQNVVSINNTKVTEPPASKSSLERLKNNFNHQPRRHCK
ncbi:hypothetical protein MOC16_gp269 [Klebsiella phage vB_KpM_FBKp24]|uniref:Uncharacterized protein n=1 Tax=Klebsiella phage vB_KpM_FBKp24 TaxID=2801834 RepID=A0A7U0GBL8_9CAUD|nr:hypothetical protein MOC16_gp269 [Klebsiella phage vB_KpM_FBKp24]QQV92222.1 hypothetical protein vBKpMFBKp24_144 [Klebsiella phage vB_KpM_FBKp24]